MAELSVHLLQELFDGGRYREVCDKLQREPPVDQQGWLLLGRSRAALGQVDQALEAFTEGLALSGDGRALEFYKASTLARRDRFQEAERLLDDCIEDPAWAHRALKTRAQARVRAGLWIDAADDYRRLNEANELGPSDQLGFAACLTQMGQWSAAEVVLDTLIGGGASTSELVWLLKGRCLESRGLYTEAAEIYQRGLDRHFESSALAAALTSAGRRRSARRPFWMLSTFASRQHVLAKWLEEQRANPLDAQLAHRLAVLASATAARLEALEHRHADKWWPIAFANWPRLLEDEAWRRQFVQERSKVYQYEASEQEQAKFLRELGDHLDRLVTIGHGDRPRVGQASLREQYLRELFAARASRRLISGEGLNLGEGKRLACGPLMLEQLQIHRPFGEMIGETRASMEPFAWMAWDDPVGPPNAQGYLRQLFSSLGYTWARMENGDYAGAIEGLRWIVCSQCATIVSTDSRGIAACCNECEQFQVRNRGLADLPERSRCLTDAAAWLRLHAHLAAARDAAMLAEPNADTATSHWREAITSLDDESRRRMLTDSLTTFVRERSEALIDSERYGSAVRWIDGALTCLPDCDELRTPLWRALTDWGIALANEGKCEEGAEALRRVVREGPAIPRARQNLVRVLHRLAEGARDREDYAKAGAVLDEAESHLRLAVASEDQTELDLVEQTRLQRIALLHNRAATEYAAGDYQSSSARFLQAFQLTEEDMSIPENVATLKTCRARLPGRLAFARFQAGEQELERGERARAKAWYELALEIDPGHESAKDRLGLF